MDRRPQDTALWLPIAVGLLMAALPTVIEVDPVLGIVHLGILLGLGAVLREAPWRAGALAAVPIVIGGLLRAGGGSGGRLLLLLLVSPLTIVISALVARAGSMLVEREPAAGDAADVDESSPTRRGMFDTKAQRGRFLVILGVLAVLVSTGLSAWGSASVDRKAAKRVVEIRQALGGRTPRELMPDAFRAMYGGDGEILPGGPYQTVEPTEKAIDATAEVRAGLQSRCIRVHLSEEGVLTTATSGGGC